jgi:hypothetical protein
MGPWAMLFQFLMFPMMVSANDNGSDIPQSLLWSLSFFILIGFIIMALYSTTSPTPLSECGYAPIYVKIDPNDLRAITTACHGA